MKESKCTPTNTERSASANQTTKSCAMNANADKYLSSTCNTNSASRLTKKQKRDKKHDMIMNRQTNIDTPGLTPSLAVRYVGSGIVLNTPQKASSEKNTNNFRYCILC